VSGPRDTDGGTRLVVRAKPKSSTEGIEVVVDADGAWTVTVRVRAPAQEGAANERVCETVADALGVPRRAVTIARGAASREKDLAIAGLDARTCAARLRPAP